MDPDDEIKAYSQYLNSADSNERDTAPASSDESYKAPSAYDSLIKDR